MTNAEFIKQLEENFNRGLEIIKRKNHDYATDTDPWKNFRFADLVGVSVDRAILVRISDKLARVSNLLDKQAMVADEKVEDTVLDAINYLNILLVYLQKNERNR